MRLKNVDSEDNWCKFNHEHYAKSYVVRSQALCLLERVSQLGPGARAAAQRRQQTLGLEERRRRERQAFALANMGRGLSRVGRVFIP